MELKLESILLPGVEAKRVRWSLPARAVQRQKNKLWTPPSNWLPKV